jgi:hypothetical protein
MLIRIICLVVAVQLLFACAMMPTTGTTVTPQTLTQKQRIASAELALLGLEEIDALIRLNNQQLKRQIAAGLQAQAATTGDFYFRKIKIDFGQQFISMQSTVDIADNTGSIINASVSGDILLDYSNNRLVWYPIFSKLNISSTNFSFENGSYAEAIPELNELVLQRLNDKITSTLMQHDHNAVPLDAIPLADVEVGTSLPGLGNATASSAQQLKGMFVVAGNAILIEPDITTIALDMNFISDLSTCPADIEVSRGVFAHKIASREPVGTASNMTDPENLRYFYSEISGAKRPMTIIHYWFADGQPLVVKELEIGPSERWRTWSASEAENSDATHWKVLVVEKESGCILHSQSVRSLNVPEKKPETEETVETPTFKALKRVFNARSSNFLISEDKPGIALIEIRRAFLQDVFKASLADLNIEAEFGQDALSQLQFTAKLLPFETREIVCEQRNCLTSPRACTATVTQCKRLRDTRDCSSCLFYNPLNNRCISEAVDPICEAARNRQNAKHDADRTACIANVEAENRDCEKFNAQAARSCEIESGIETSTCDLVKTGIEALPPGAVLAGINADTKTRGQLSAVFSRFRIEDDFSRLKLDMALKSDLEVSGSLKFSPNDIPAPLKACINTWSKPFSSRAVAESLPNSILTSVDAGEKALTARWSGFAMPLTITPPPLESVFVNDPQLLAKCGIGLTVKDVEQVIAGDEAAFFSGQMKLEVQPLPTRIIFSPATVIYGEQSYQAEAVLGDNHLRYDIKK